MKYDLSYGLDFGFTIYIYIYIYMYKISRHLKNLNDMAKYILTMCRHMQH
jgi:hypothetical protein